MFKPLRAVGPASRFFLLPCSVVSTDMPEHNGEAILKGEGFKFYEPCSDFSSLRPAEMPWGWKINELEKKKGSDVRGYELLDGKDRLRARIRVKEYWHHGIAPRVERADARMDVICAFSINQQREKGTIGATLNLLNRQIFKQPMIPMNGLDIEKYWEEMRASMLKMLDESYPLWKVSSKYWEPGFRHPC